MGNEIMANEIFLKLEGIKKSFGGVHALKVVDLEIRKGEIHCLAGENGCGKSTLIKSISGVMEKMLRFIQLLMLSKIRLHMCLKIV